MFSIEQYRERGVLKGANFLLGKTTVFRPGEPTSVPIIAPPGTFPPIRHNSAEKILQTKTSLRSRLAQLGFDIANGLAESLWREIQSDDLDWQGRLIKTIQTNYTLLNRSQQEIEIAEGSGIGRLFYCDWDKDLLRGRALKNFFQPSHGTPLLEIEGVHGENWKWEYAPLQEEKDENIIGVCMRLQPGRKWIPPAERAVPIKIDDQTRDYRTQIDKLLVDVPPGHKSILWIGETPKLKLPWGVDGVLSPLVHGGFKAHERGIARHIHSLLIDGGSNWPIRVEIVSDDQGHEFYYVCMQFAASFEVINS